MATWKTAEEISRLYLVGPERLADYSRRGNLPMMRDTSGIDVFDEDCVARFFRLRSAAAVLSPPGESFGVLGEMKLGAQVLPPRPGARDERTRALRMGKTLAVNDTSRRTGTG